MHVPNEMRKLARAAKRKAQYKFDKLKNMAAANRQDVRLERAKMDTWQGSRKLHGDGTLRYQGQGEACRSGLRGAGMNVRRS